MTRADKPRRPDVSEVELIGGPEAVRVSLQNYREEWGETFLDHRRRILDALSGRRWDDMNDYAEAKTEIILAIKRRARTSD